MVDFSNALNLHYHWDLTFLTFLKKQQKCPCFSVCTNVQILANG